MHARQLVEYAGLAALHAPSLIEQPAPLGDDALAEYWVASRCRMDEWGRALRLLGHSQSAAATPQAPCLAALGEEILLSEVLARIVAAITAAHDQSLHVNESAPIGSNTLEGCIEARQRWRTLAAAWWPADSPKRRLLRSLEKRAAHWSDVLLAYVARGGNVDAFALDVSRLREFAYDAHPHNAVGSEAVAELLRFSLSAAFSAATRPPVCGDLNRRICGAALGLFSDTSFDGLGLLRRPWMIRAERSAEQASTLIAALLQDGLSNPRLPAPARWRR
ncbi:hypothetical protein [Botrimarina hoheduenensis]|uniref:Uncharacterized protein n=1 Tax=Botrimarina hoheduenensis TaxID=2528000 RepID=A0A5C5W8G0_9BACT|nr:hypothetical protein [Botrimarina hoheduenensis]TWT46543.1 hypothetical protein Pla111_16390 [Botrimarina hoheduenensis]